MVLGMAHTIGKHEHAGLPTNVEWPIAGRLLLCSTIATPAALSDIRARANLLLLRNIRIISRMYERDRLLDARYNTFIV